MYLSLDEFSVFRFRFGKSGVNVLDDSFKRRKFHHGIRDLSTPKRLQAFIQSGNSFGRGDFIPTFKGSTGKGRDCSLHAHFDCFPWTKEDISEEFGRGRGGEIECCAVFMGCFFTHDVGVLFLEKFVETVLSGTLTGLICVWKRKGSESEGRRGWRGWKGVPWKEYPTRVGPQPVKFPLNPSAL